MLVVTRPLGYIIIHIQVAFLKGRKVCGVTA